MRVENVNYKGILVGSSASISSMNAIQGMSVGATSGFGSMLLHTTFSVSFGINGQTITMSRLATGSAVMSHYPLPGYFGIEVASVDSGSTAATGGSTQATMSAYIAPMILPYNLSFNQVECIAYSVAQGASASGSVSEGFLYGLYSLNQSTAFSLVSSFAANINKSQGSVSSQTFHWYWGTNSTANSSSSFFAGDSGTNFTGTRKILLSSGAGSLSASHYFLAAAYTGISTSASVGRISSLAFISGNTTNMNLSFGANTSAPHDMFIGLFSTTTNGTTSGMLVMPASINTSAITSNSRIPHIQFRTI